MANAKSGSQEAALGGNTANQITHTHSLETWITDTTDNEIRLALLRQLRCVGGIVIVIVDTSSTEIVINASTIQPGGIMLERRKIGHIF